MQDLDLGELQDISNRLMSAHARRCPPSSTSTPTSIASTPAVQVKIDRDRAAALGVTAQQIETALGEAFGGQQISQIYTSRRTSIR